MTPLPVGVGRTERRAVRLAYRTNSTHFKDSRASTLLTPPSVSLVSSGANGHSSDGGGGGGGNGARRTDLRSLSSLMVERQAFARDVVGLTYYDSATGQFLRNLYATLGYARSGSLKFSHYLHRYERGGIAERIIDAYPQATWSGGARIVEDPDPSTETVFEAAVRELFDRLQVWSRLTRADTLAGLGQYSVLLIGAPPKNLELELPSSLRAEDIKYLMPISESRVTIESYDDKDIESPRYGLPLYYNLKLPGTGQSSRRVHHSRVIHIADGLLESDLFGKPRLRAVWNYLDDLDKIIGGGAEAAWKRMDPGMQVNVDPEMPFSATEQQALSDEIDEYQHGVRRVMRTRGTEVNLLSTTVAGFGPNADAVIKLISATTGIPYRILTGSERGELASTQDRLNWSDRITERRRSFATPLIRELLSRLIDRNALPAPSTDVIDGGKAAGGKGLASEGVGYTILWPEVGEIDNVTKADVIGKLAGANQSQYIAGLPPVITSDEIRRIILALGPMDPSDIPPSKAELDLQRAELAAKAKQQAADAVNSGGAGGSDNDATLPSTSGEGGQNE